LPAPILNGGGDFENGRISNCDLGSGHTACRHVSLIDLYLNAKCQWNQRNFLWTYARTHNWDRLYWGNSVEEST